jgi:hypothetical protein
MRAWFGVLVLLTLGCATPEASAPAPAPSVQTFRGLYSFGFEVSTFEGCWLNMSGDAWATFESRHPEIAETRSNGGAYNYEIRFEGTRREGMPAGHMGLYHCQYDVTRLLESRRAPLRP